MGEHAQAWAEALAAWAIPDEILAQAPESPWFHDPASFAVEGPLPRDTRSAVRALAFLSQAGERAAVLDVGCGGGRSSLALVPPALSLIGVDQSAEMLASFSRAATTAGVSAQVVQGRWPDVAPTTPFADVVVCHHVLYNVPDIEPFLLSLTDHARVGVVVEITVRHPLARLNPAWRHFWNLERPAGPAPEDVVAILGALGIEAALERTARPPMNPAARAPERQVAFLRRRLCLPASRDGEIGEFLRREDLDAPVDVATISWAGRAAGGD